ncbi:MAG: HD domain-containing protein [Lachnospiraceae bacterium]|nr:HD domain-containing protein [Lachnospiraceae bacterium]
MNAKREAAVNDNLQRYGKHILDSAEFTESFTQAHHIDTTVGDHTMYVSRTSLRICYYLNKLHIRTDMEDMVVGSLCHDLGIMGREDKFSNKRQCYREHPDDSVEVARKLNPELSTKTEKMIRNHMWPYTSGSPGSKEGYILVVADKYCSVREGMRVIKNRIKKQISNNY